MPAPAFFHWLDSTPLSSFIRNSIPARASLETLHLLSIGIAVGTVMIVDLSILGTAMRRHRAPQITRELMPWTWGGWAAVLLTGGLIFLSESAKMYNSQMFCAKMLVLLAALLNQLALSRQAIRNNTGVTTRLAAALSLFLWFGAGFIGRGIDF